jgi:hypothetical protein
MERIFLISLFAATLFLIMIGPLVVLIVRSSRIRNFCVTRDISFMLFFFIVIHSTIIFSILFSSVLVLLFDIDQLV